MEGIFAEILNMSMISCIVITAVMIIRQIFRRAPKAFFGSVIKGLELKSSVKKMDIDESSDNSFVNFRTF